MNDHHLEIRPVQLPDHYPAMAAIICATDEDFRPTPETLKQEDATLDPALQMTRFIAENVKGGEARAVGMAVVGLDRWNPQAGVFNLNIRVLPEYQRHGIGMNLYRTVLNHLEPSKPKQLKAHAREDNQAANAFLAGLGFTEVWRRFQSKLNVSTFDFTPYDGLEAKLEATGIRIVTYPELEGDAERDRKLFDLDMEVFEDIPLGEEFVRPSFERWKTDYIDPQRALKDAFFVAVEGQEFVGLSALWDDAPGLLTAITGVRRTHRGMGLALALKLRGIRYAVDHDNREISTMNDAPNAAMIGINEKLGFKRAPEWVRFAKTFEEKA